MTLWGSIKREYYLNDSIETVRTRLTDIVSAKSSDIKYSIHGVTSKNINEFVFYPKNASFGVFVNKNVRTRLNVKLSESGPCTKVTVVTYSNSAYRIISALILINLILVLGRIEVSIKEIIILSVIAIFIVVVFKQFMARLAIALVERYL